MKFQKGRPKTGGRKKGVKNKSSSVKDLISDFIKNKMGDMEPLWNDLDNREKISLFTSLLKYVIPPATLPEEDGAECDDGESTVKETIRQLNEFKSKKTG